MHAHRHRHNKILLLMASSILLVAFTSTPAIPAGSHHPALPSCENPAAHLELSVEPTIAFPGTLITLHIAYVQIGMPYTGITVDPPGLVAFEPPLNMPCKYNEHPNHCTAITFRTQATGVVQFNAGATGEVWDEACRCFCMSTALDDGPATLVIVESVSKVYLPSIYR